ncbi:MAG: FkbM family methyltransferase [Oscillospiraceae bacterium]|jgi:FkbM family methyltransferase|nr:FkbM family methyltransferase [Oscillospiraceae bacterium]
MFTETVSLWQYLEEAAESNRPIIIYGMGNGAEKILAVMEARGLEPAAFMASDEFVRGHSFRGFEVKKLADIERQYSDFIILIAFGTNRPDVLEKIERLTERYEVYAPDVPVYGDVLFDEKYVVENVGKIKEVRELLADEQSKEIFDKLIDYRISGKLEPLRATVSARQNALDLLNIKLDESEVFFDFGAYDGDTAQEFAEYTGGSYNKIYAFEPDFRSFCKLRRRHYLIEPVKLEAINAAVYNQDGEEKFSNAAGRQSSMLGVLTKDKKIKTIKADTFCEKKQVKPTLIKIDVEGCERPALEGAAATLKKHKPKLIVSLYHRTEDLLELPLMLRKMNSRYKMYLRRHEYIPAWDINLYCV